MIVVGIVGGIGAGKTTAARLLAEKGGGVALEADRIVHDLLAEPAIQARISADLGTLPRRSDGSVDREGLARDAFSDDAALVRLEAILHPPVLVRLRARLEEAQARGTPLAVLDVPLLLEIIGLKPENVKALHNLAAVYINSGQLDKARETIQQIRKLNPEMATELESYLV